MKGYRMMVKERIVLFYKVSEGISDKVTLRNLNKVRS